MPFSWFTKKRDSQSQRGNLKKAATANDQKKFLQLTTTDPAQWKVGDVLAWLDLIEFGQYKAMFESNAITGHDLLELTNAELSSLEMTRLGHRKQILRKIEALKKKNNSKAFQAGQTDDYARSKEEDSESSSTTTSDSNKRSTSSKSISGSGQQRFKASFEERTKLFSVATPVTYKKLRSAIRKNWPGKKLRIFFIDEDGDKIDITSDEDLKEVLDENGGSAAIKLLLEYSSSKNKVTSAETDLLENLVDPVVLIDTQGQVLFFNKAAEKFWGYSRSEVRDVIQLMPKVIANQHQTFIDNYLTTGKSKIIGRGRAVKVLLKNGKEAPAHLSISETHTSKRHTFTATIRAGEHDDSEEIDNSAYAMYDDIPETVLVIDAVGLILYANSRIEKMLGYAPNQIVGKNIKTIMPKEEADKHDGYLLNYAKTGIKKVIGTGRRVVAQKKDGTAIPVHLTLLEQKLGHAASNFIGMIREYEDAEATETLLQSERNIVNNLVAPGIIIDETGIIQAFNGAAQTLFGYSYVEVIARNVKILMNAKDQADHDKYLESYLKTRQSKIIGIGREVIAQKKDGTQFRISLAVTEKNDGEVTIFTGVFAAAKKDKKSSKKSKK